MTISPLFAIPNSTAAIMPGISSGAPSGPGGPDFLDMVSAALHGVSAAQNQAAAAQAGYAAGAPGATLGNALVTSDQASVAWNATVAVRNEMVSAYQSIMNMQF